VRAQDVPHELKASGQWVLWKWLWLEERKKWTKPRVMGTGEAASVTDPKTWTSFGKAYEAYRDSERHFAGVGYVLFGDGLVGLDLDHVRDPLHGGVVEEWAFALLLGLQTYVEVSPSG